MKFEVNLLDKIINRGMLGKRQLGRPTKFNIVNKQGRGALELMYKPRNRFEEYIGKAIHGVLPMLSYFTYRFHVMRARESGMKLEDTYHQKFFREPYHTWHIYAQYFHPWTLQERVRDVHFYRRPKTLFKGFTVPDWAQSHKRQGTDMDVEYSRQAWEKAMQEFQSEWTPMPFVGDRLEPNIINWFRFEQVGKGFSSRLFYNEEPKPSWHRHGGHLEDKEKTLYSFKYGDQKHEDVLGFDVTTEEGRKGLQAEVDRWRTMTPEIHKSMGLPDGNLQFTKQKYISNEPHFQRVMTHYRQYVFQQNVSKAIDSGLISEDDFNASRAFLNENGLSSGTMISMGEKGLLDGEPGYESFKRVLNAIGLDDFRIDYTTTKPLEDQILHYFDAKFNITEKGLNQTLPLLVSDERQRVKIESLLEEGGDLSTALPQEDTKTLQ